MKRMETMDREGLDNIACTDGQSACRAGRVVKSRLEAERSREMADKTGMAEGGVGTGLKGRDKALLCKQGDVVGGQTKAEKNRKGRRSEACDR